VDFLEVINAVIDSQSVKALHAETRDYDAGKKIVGPTLGARAILAD
jgi:hypothetical protein